MNEKADLPTWWDARTEAERDLLRALRDAR